MSNPTGKGGLGERKHQINRLGRPKSFDAFRTLAQSIAHEPAQSKDKDGNLHPVTIDGKVATNAELMLRKWFASNDARLQMHAMEVAFGKVPTPVEVGGPDGGPLTLEIVERIVDADLTPDH
jgi:hypothetical protein